MTDLLLPFCAALAAMLLLGGTIASLIASQVGGIAASACCRVSLACCLLGAGAALLHLLLGASPTSLTVPLGLAGQPTILAMDGVSDLFLLLLMLVGAACAAALLGGPPPAAAPMLSVSLGAMTLALLAADAFALVTAFGLMAVAAFVLVMTDHRTANVRSADRPTLEIAAAGSLTLGMAAAGLVCLVVALALLSDEGASYEAIRAHPPEGARAVLVFWLVLAGTAAQAGLVPLYGWLAPAQAAAHAATPGPVAALISGGIIQVALYGLVRLLFDLCGPAQPLWWGLPLLAMGVAGAVLGGLRAATDTDFGRIVAGGVVGNAGLAAICLGIALAARAADLPALAGLALAAALLHALVHGLFAALLGLGAGAIRSQVHSLALDRLGGLIRRTPITAGGVLLGAACLAGLPPTPAFASQWMLLQSVLGAVRLGGLGLQILICLVAIGLALATGLAAFAAVRLVGAALLGRARSRASAEAVEAAPPTRWAIVVLSGLLVVLGLAPGMSIGLAGPALRLLAGATAPDSGLILRPAADLPGYAPLGVVLALAVAIAAIAVSLRTRAVLGHRTAPAWEGGLHDIAAQPGDGFAQPLRRALGQAPPDGRTPIETLLLAPLAIFRAGLFRRAGHLTALTLRQALAAMVAALILTLSALAVVEQL